MRKQTSFVPTFRAGDRARLPSSQHSGRVPVTKVLVLYYSSYGHIETMAYAAAEGAREGGAEAIVKRVPELVPPDVAKSSGFKLDQKAPIAAVAEMAEYDAIIFGTGTRFGNMTAQMKNFLDQAGG